MTTSYQIKIYLIPKNLSGDPEFVCLEDGSCSTRWMEAVGNFREAEPSAGG